MTDRTQEAKPAVQIMHHLKNAAGELLAAYQLATKTNPMAADLPVFIQVQRLQKEIGEAMQAISKVRGL